MECWLRIGPNSPLSCNWYFSEPWSQQPLIFLPTAWTKSFWVHQLVPTFPEAFRQEKKPIGYAKVGTLKKNKKTFSMNQLRVPPESYTTIFMLTNTVPKLWLLPFPILSLPPPVCTPNFFDVLHSEQTNSLPRTNNIFKQAPEYLSQLYSFRLHWQWSVVLKTKKILELRLFFCVTDHSSTIISTTKHKRKEFPNFYDWTHMQFFETYTSPTLMHLSRNPSGLHRGLVDLQ